MEPNNKASRITRRETLKTAAFMILPAGLARGYAANEKLNIGVIGLRQGRLDARLLDGAGANIAALCDVDSVILEKRGDALPADLRGDYPSARRYTDFRKMIENEKLDGVVVATPDHSHAYISVWAMKHGLHVYCEKPLTQTVHEARVMARVAAETKVITQMGTQTSAAPNNLRTAELIQSGALGEITEVHLSLGSPVWPQGLDRPPGVDPVPPTLDWDTWLGTAAVRPYLAKWPQGSVVYSPERKRQFNFAGAVYHPHNWRGWTEFGSGAVGDQAPHAMNVIFFTLELGAPSAVEVVETSGMTREMYPDWSIIRWEWPQRGIHPPFKIYWYDGGKRLPKEIAGEGGRGGLVWIGTKGSLPKAEARTSGRSKSRMPGPRLGTGAASKCRRTGA